MGSASVTIAPDAGPVHAKAMLCTVLSAHKAAARAALQGSITVEWPASGLRMLDKVGWLLDESAAASLRRNLPHEVVSQLRGPDDILT